MAVDFGRTADDYAAFRVPFTPRLFERLRDFGVGVAGQTVLDVGAGTGLLARELQSRGCDVTLSDTSIELLRRVEEGARGAVVAPAECLPFAAESFDIVTAAQCWHWFDRTRAPFEIHRVLRPGGRLAAIYQTYIPLPGSVAEASERLILRYRRGWRHANSSGISGQVLRDMQVAGFVGIESFSFDVEIAFNHEQWRGYVRASSAVGASMPADELQRFDADHAALLRNWPAELRIPHRVFAAIAVKNSRTR